MLIKIIFCILLSVGLWLLALDIFKIPYIKTSKAVKNLLSKRKVKENAAELWLSGLSKVLAQHIRINEYKRISLLNDLRSADITLSPEQFRANAVVKAGVIGVFAIPMIFIFPLLSPVFLIAAVITYTGEGRRLAKKLKQRRQKIEYGLPGLASSAEKNLKHSRDVMQIIESYAANTEKELSDELKITAADMKSGGYETAITRLERRVGSPNTTDQNGNGKINFGVPYGTYIIREVTFPEGYTYSGQTEWTVKVCDETQDVLIRAVNKLKSAKIKVVKTDSETGQTVKGITGFKIRNVKTGEESELYYTDENGVLSLPEPFAYGSYELIEVSPPEGYNLNSVPVSFRVDGSVPEITLKLTDKPQKGRISVIKTGEVFYSVKEENGVYTPIYSEQGLKGAEIEVYSAEDIYTSDGTLRLEKDALAETLVTDEAGKAVSGELYLGKYLLKEKTAPEGFILSTEPTEITVTAGTVSAEIHNERQRTETSLKKELEKDSDFGIGDNGEILSVRFGLFAADELEAFDGSVIPADGLIEEVTPNEDGEVIFTADMPFGAEYYIKELETDSHYLISEEYYESGELVTNKIIRGQIKGIKTDESGRSLSGALIGLFYPFETVFDTDTAIAICETDGKGEFVFRGVPKGEWIVRELIPPDGYILSKENNNAVITEDGEILSLKLINQKIPDEPHITETPKTGDTRTPIYYLLTFITAAITAAYLQIKKQRSNSK